VVAAAAVQRLLVVRLAQPQVPELVVLVRCWVEPADWSAGLTRP